MTRPVPLVTGATTSAVAVRVSVVFLVLILALGAGACPASGRTSSRGAASTFQWSHRFSGNQAPTYQARLTGTLISVGTDIQF